MIAINWHKRNRAAAKRIDVVPAVAGSSYGFGRKSEPFVQISFRSESHGLLNVVMTPDEAAAMGERLQRSAARAKNPD